MSSFVSRRDAIADTLKIWQDMRGSSWISVSISDIADITT